MNFDSDTNLPADVVNTDDNGKNRNELAVVYTLADCLQNFDVYCGGTAVVTIVLELIVTDDAHLSFLGCES